MLKLACPTCGANLELPDQLDVAHCMYCGSKIILRAENVLNEIVNVKRFSELADVAIQAKNYEDAIKYSNSVLEIDTQNIEAWLTKAEAAFWLSTPLDGNNISYVRKPKGFRITVDKPMITKNQEVFRTLAELVKRTWQSGSDN
jgi:DNA-directed RNA polymerase subunit RPC12/RpoP